MTSFTDATRYLGYHVIGSDGMRLRDVFKDSASIRNAASAAFHTITRRKAISPTVMTDGRLARCLTTLDLTALGIGSTLGVGVYVLAGSVSKFYAGPSVIISFLIAAIASIFAGLCYAEFGARVPKAGSAYVYSYVCVGEFIAFIIGWNLILEYVIGSASVVKGLSQYLDSLLNNTMSTHLQAAMPIGLAHLSPYPDFFAFTITMVFSVALAFGVKESSKFNNIFTFVNLSVVILVIVSGAFKASPSNWRIPQSEVPEGYGTGGFAPYGLPGIIRGAAICFYGFIGFDCVATAGEEARDPQKSIPIAVVVSLLVIFLAYFGISTVLTMMLPYYMQDENAPFPFIFDYFGWTAFKYIVSIGAMCGLCSSLLGAMFPLPRIIYAMAADGLVFHFLGTINRRFQTPLVGTLVAGLFTGTLAAIFQLDQLISMMSIGTLLAYSMVASCVLILRYEHSSTDKKVDDKKATSATQLFCTLVNYSGSKKATPLSSGWVKVLVTVYCACCFAVAGIVEYFSTRLANFECGVLIALSLAVLTLLAILYCIWRQPVSDTKLSFSVPFVPWLPGISILINVYLMLNLDYMTWIRFGVWIAAGLTIYLFYGAWHSLERRRSPSNDFPTANGTLGNSTPTFSMNGLTVKGSRSQIYQE